MKNEEDIPLTKEDIKKIKKILKNTKFEEFKIHSHYYRDKFTGEIGKTPRHGIDLIELKKIYEKPENIKRGLKREGNKTHKYTLSYHESTNVFVKIFYLFDEKPMKIFNAMRIFRNLEKAILKKYGLRI